MSINIFAEESCLSLVSETHISDQVKLCNISPELHHVLWTVVHLVRPPPPPPKKKRKKKEKKKKKKESFKKKKAEKNGKKTEKNGQDHHVQAMVIGCAGSVYKNCPMPRPPYRLSHGPRRPPVCGAGRSPAPTHPGQGQRSRTRHIPIISDLDYHSVTSCWSLFRLAIGLLFHVKYTVYSYLW